MLLLKTWNVVGPQVEVVLEFFIVGSLLKQVNHSEIVLIPKVSQIVLIPKVTHAQKVKDFRPIFCNNDLYKIIAMILTFCDYFGTGCFHSREELSENVHLVQKLLRQYNRKCVSLRCMIKLNIHKAYNLVSWRFL